jgi:hypothetical protein
MMRVHEFVRTELQHTLKKESYMHEGSPVTRGSGPEAYTARIVFEISGFDKWKDDSCGTFDLSGFPASISRQDHYYVLRVTGFSTIKEAERFTRIVQAAMMELAAKVGLTLWVQPISPVERNEISTNSRMRDGLAERHHPEWDRRTDGSVTDGGVWPSQSCILAEHERIWEYPVLWGKPLRELTVAALQGAVVGANRRHNVDAALDDRRLTAATKFLNLANGEPSREVGFVLFATVLETLADENGQVGVGKLVAECRRTNGETYDENEGRELYRIRNKLVHERLLRLNGTVLSWDEFSERYWRIRALAGQGVILRLNDLSR